MLSEKKEMRAISVLGWKFSDTHNQMVEFHSSPGEFVRRLRKRE